MTTQATPTELVTRYYEALDTHDYELLETVLAPAFVQHRPDRTFEDRDAFVAFMRDGRPNATTRHELEGIIAEGNAVAARGRLLDESRDDELLFRFADHFTIAADQISRLETYTR